MRNSLGHPQSFKISEVRDLAGKQLLSVRRNENDLPRTSEFGQPVVCLSPRRRAAPEDGGGKPE
jgi:hypothetical protein